MIALVRSAPVKSAMLRYAPQKLAPVRLVSIRLAPVRSVCCMKFQGSFHPRLPLGPGHHVKSTPVRLAGVKLAL